MSTFDPEKLTVEYMSDTTTTEPVILRRYTLTHSDFTRELFLDIGRNFAWEKISPLRDEVFAEWKRFDSLIIFIVYIYIDLGEFSTSDAKRRDEIFRRELPLALQAIRYGDRLLFDTHRYLDQIPIVINFMSTYPAFAKQEYWGTFYSFLKYKKFQN